jgi:hypothetical protein
MTAIARWSQSLRLYSPMGCRRSNAAGRVLSRRFPPRAGAGSGMGAVIARRFRDEGAAVVRTGRTREKLTKVVSQFDQERSLIHVSDLTKPDRRATRQCAPGLVKVRTRLTKSNCRLFKFARSIDPRTFADEAASVGNDNSGAVGRSALPAAAGNITNATQFPSVEILL